MSLNACASCWDTPCHCGYEYYHWKPEQRKALAELLMDEEKYQELMQKIDSKFKELRKKW